MPTPPVSALVAQMGEGPAPLYARVKQMIIQQIDNGSWPPHHRVPSESELVNELDPHGQFSSLMAERLQWKSHD